MSSFTSSKVAHWKDITTDCESHFSDMNKTVHIVKLALCQTFKLTFSCCKSLFYDKNVRQCLSCLLRVLVLPNIFPDRQRTDRLTHSKEYMNKEVSWLIVLLNFSYVAKSSNTVHTCVFKEQFEARKPM